jgi:hypothetical protein
MHVVQERITHSASCDPATTSTLFDPCSGVTDPQATSVVSGWFVPFGGDVGCGVLAAAIAWVASTIPCLVV